MQIDSLSSWKQKFWVAVNDIDDDINCDICLDDDVDDEKTDDLVLCDHCNVAVHQSCYGHDILKKFPDTQYWYCQRCRELMKQPSS